MYRLLVLWWLIAITKRRISLNSIQKNLYFQRQSKVYCEVRTQIFKIVSHEICSSKCWSNLCLGSRNLFHYDSIQNWRNVMGLHQQPSLHVRNQSSILATWGVLLCERMLCTWQKERTGWICLRNFQLWPTLCPRREGHWPWARSVTEYTVLCRANCSGNSLRRLNSLQF